MENDKKEARKEKMISRIEAMISKVENASTIRLILDGEEMLHDFSAPGDVYKTMQKIKEAVISEFMADIEDIKNS